MVEDSSTTSLSVAGEIGVYPVRYPICCWFLFFALPIIHIKGGISANGNASLSLTNSHKAFKDFNGDGYVDYVQKVGNNLEVFESKIARTNKLKTVTNPLKGSFTIDYKFQKTDYSNPHPKWVMSEVKVSDGYDRELKGQNTYVKRFLYENGRYDRRERSFYGYESVKAQNVVLGGSNGDELQEIVRTSVAKYHNSSYFLDGLLKESYVLQGDDETKKFSRTENFYKIRKLNDANTGILSTVLPDNFDEGGTFGRQSAAVVLANTKNYLYELSTTPLMTTNVSFIYDTIGRVVSSRNYGDLAVTTDDYTTTIAYHSSTALTAKHILNVPSSIIVTNQIPSQLRKRTTTVDDYGNVLTVDAHHGGGLATTTMKYDTYGNLTEKTLPPNETGGSMFYKYTYDPTHFYKVIKIEDAFGLSSTVSYYLPTAPTNHYYYDNDKVIETTDWTGNKMQYTYDTSARMLTIRGPKEIAANVAHTIKFDYYFKRASLPSGNGMTSDADFVPVAVTSHYDPQYPTNFIETYTFIDGLGRPMQVKKDIERNIGTPQAPNYQEYLSISGWISYDALGRAVTQKLPREEPKSNAQRFWINEAPALVAQTNLYDAIDRPIEVLDALNNVTEIAYSIGQDNFGNTALKTRTSVQNNVQNIVSETYKDVNGRVVSTMNEGPNNNAIWTRFKYNAIGELLAYIDAENKETSYDYDLLGRKIILKHPDNGKTSFIYDNASNLIRLQTANLEAGNSYIVYQYDKSRLVKISYPNTPSGANINNVIYDYGPATLSGAEANQRGRLIRQQDATGEQEFKYGDMGEMVYNKRIIVGPNIPSRVFETRFEYDTWNRLKSMQYPDGENVNYTYDKGGNLKKTTGQLNSQNYDYIKQIDYDHFEQRTYVKYGNNTETSYAYTPELRRLNNLKVKTAAQQDLFNNTYQYDLVGNVTAVQNNAGASSNNMGGTYSHSYTYDKLNRLSTANGVFNGSTAISNGNAYQSNYTLTMDYNDTHGIKSKKQNHTLNNVGNSKNTYNNAYDYYENTHRVKSILNQQGGILEYFTYDANGNMKTRGDMNKVYASYYWDESNRLRVVNDYKSLHHYLYDASGERILKAGSDSEAIYENGSLVNPSSVTLNSYTTYPSAFMVIDPNGVYSKHYYAGSQRIVSRLGDDKADIFNYKKSRAGRPASDGATEFDEKAVQQAQISDLQQYLDEAKLGKATFKEYRGTTYKEEEKALQEEALEDNPGLQRAPASTPIYFYHPDHLGTSTFLTDANGVAYQFFLNLPFGETMAEQHPDSYYRTPFKFSGKELDEETGLHYFGARYYDSRSSIWLSVDPLAESFPNWNPYNYTMQNPINLVDPTGMSPENNSGEGNPPKKGLIQSISDGLKGIFGTFVSDANKLVASKGQDEQAAKRLARNSAIVDVISANTEAVGEAMTIANPYGDEVYLLSLWGTGQEDKLIAELKVNGKYYLAGALLPYVNGKGLKKGSSIFLTWSKNSKGHLIKHADALGFSGKTPAELQKMLPQLRAAANQLLNNADSALTRTGQWHGHSNAMMYISNGKMLVTQSDGTFITIINKTSNNWYQLANPIR